MEVGFVLHHVECEPRVGELSGRMVLLASRIIGMATVFQSRLLLECYTSPRMRTRRPLFNFDDFLFTFLPRHHPTPHPKLPNETEETHFMGPLSQTGPTTANYIWAPFQPIGGRYYFLGEIFKNTLFLVVNDGDFSLIFCCAIDFCCVFILYTSFKTCAFSNYESSYLSK